MKVKKPMLGTGGEVLTDANGKVITEEVLEEVTEQQHVPADVGAIKILSFEQSKGQMEGEPRQAGAGEKARCQRQRSARSWRNRRQAAAA